MTQNQESILRFLYNNYKKTNFEGISGEEFTKHFSDTQRLRDELGYLKALGYITVLYASDKINSIMLNRKGIALFE